MKIKPYLLSLILGASILSTMTINLTAIGGAPVASADEHHAPAELGTEALDYDFRLDVPICHLEADRLLSHGKITFPKRYQPARAHLLKKEALIDLLTGVHSADLKSIRSALADGADPKSVILASESSHYHEGGLEIFRTKYRYIPALIYAIDRGHVEVVAELIAAGADPITNGGLVGINYKSQPLGSKDAPYQFSHINTEYTPLTHVIASCSKPLPRKTVTAENTLPLATQLNVIKILLSHGASALDRTTWTRQTCHTERDGEPYGTYLSSYFSAYDFAYERPDRREIVKLLDEHHFKKTSRS